MMAARVSTRVVVLRGGVGGLAAARHLERLFRDRADTEIVLVSRDNFFLLSPLLFEAWSGVLDVRHCVHPQVWAVGDCAAIPGPDGQPYPALAQHALREARVVADNIHAVTAGQPPTPFTYHTIGIMAAFGRMSAAADVQGFHLTGFPAWWLRRSYYLFQMPRWDTRLRIVFDWTVALFFRSEPTQLSLHAEREQRSLGRPVVQKLSEMPLQGDLWQEEQGEPSNL